MTTSHRDWHVAHDALVQLTAAMDARDWERWIAHFAPDARLDYADAGATGHSLLEVRSTLEHTLDSLDHIRHHVTNVALTEVTPGSAGRTASPIGVIGATAAYVCTSRSGTGPSALVGGRYDVELVELADGWRVQALRATVDWWT